jgi:hypothetical protein
MLYLLRVQLLLQQQQNLNYTDGVTSAIQTQLDTKATTGKAIAMALVFG